MTSLQKFVPPVVGALVGAVIVGGIWVGTSASSSNGGVVAKVGSTTITHKQLLQETESYAGAQMLSQLISNQLILDAAKKQNVTATSAEVNTQLQQLEQQNGITSDAQLQSQLQQSHMTKQQLMDQLKISVLEQKLAEAKVTVTDKQIQDYYNKNKGSLGTPETRAVSHIVVASKATADKLKQELSQGKSFATLAKQNSTDSNTKANGGSLGNVSEADLQQADPDIATAAFKLKKGEVSAPIQTKSGSYELVTVTGITPAKTPTLAASKSKITSILKQQGAQSSTQLLSTLAKSDPITIVDSSYSSVKSQIENPAPTGLGG